MLHPKLKRFLSQKSGYFLVTGPPGTAKTYSLIELLLYLLDKKQIDPSRILVFCFNRRWAKILRERLAESAERSIFEVQITSFFSFCADFIEKTFYLKGPAVNEKPPLIDFNNKIQILNATRQWKLLKEVIDSLEKKYYPLTFKYMGGNSFVRNSFTQEVFDFILRAQESLLTPSDLSCKLTSSDVPFLSEIAGIYDSYNKALLKGNLYNYGRLLADTVDILKNNSGIRNSARQLYDFIIIDELQELNKAQFQIAELLSMSNLIFFGNDDESIYAFRGSMINNFGKVLEKIYQGSNPEKNVLFLKTNYRNNYYINKVCENFINLNESRISKSSLVKKNPQAKNGIKNVVHAPVITKEFKTVLDEVNFIVEQIKKCIILKKVDPEDICILVKGLGYKTVLIENALRQNKILFTYRTSRTILENTNIQYIINFLKLITLLDEEIKGSNEYTKIVFKEGDRNNFKNRLLGSILGSVFVGVSPLFIKRTSSYCNNNLWESICLLDNEEFRKAYKNSGGFDDGEMSKLIDFKNRVNDILKLNSLSVYEFVLKFLNTERIGIIDFLLKDKNISESEKESSLNILGDYLESLKDFSVTEPLKSSVKDYLLFLADIEGNDFLEEIEESTKEIIKQGYVNILSYHHCKGLEFEAVFMPFINKNYLPAAFGKAQLYDMQIFNYFAESKTLLQEEIRKRHMESERNLFYTGMTRAKSYLFITANAMEDKSIFFEEVTEICRNLKNSVKDKYGKQKKAQDISRNDSAESYLPGFFELIYSDPASKWLVRKTAAARTFKLKKGIKINIKNYFMLLSFLKLYYPYKKWWSRRNFTINRISPYEIMQPVFSYTSLNNYIECPYRYKLRNYIGLKEKKSLSLILGSAYHEILKNFFKEPCSDFSRSRLLEIIDKVFKELEFEFEYLRKVAHLKAVSDFKKYFDNYLPCYALNILTEKEFRFEFNGERFIGRIDQLNILDDDTVELIDFKSGSNKMSGSFLENEIQLRLYRFAVDLSSEMEFIKNKKYLLKYVFLGDERNQIYKLPDGFYDFENFAIFLKSITESIKKENFEPEPLSSYSCIDCDFRIVCPDINAK